jgi:hypothetical protein
MAGSKRKKQVYKIHTLCFVKIVAIKYHLGEISVLAVEQQPV